MTKLKTSAALLMALSALAACGGGGGGGSGDGGGGGGAIPDYVGFTDASEPVDSTLGGQTLLTDGSSATIRVMSGSLRHNTRALTDLSDGVRTFSDADGDDAGVWTDGTLTFQPDSSVPAGDFSAYYRFIEEGGESSAGIIGVVIDAGDVPTTAGDTIYTGTAQVVGVSDPGGAANSLNDVGSSRLTVDFMANTVDLEITASNSGLIYDTVDITGMTIDNSNRNSFGGGSLSMSKNTTDVTGTVLGTNVTEDAQGNFFGFDDVTGNPAEAGGVFAAEGDTGEIFGAFIAD
ncbi:MAG: transferrin-binding protein-like solute binding protein [Pseudomonadota bacterium]